MCWFPFRSGTSALPKQQTVWMHFDPEVVDKLFALNKHVIMGKLEGDASLPERIVVESVIGSVRSKLARGSASAYTFSDNEQERQQAWSWPSHPVGIVNTSKQA